jgi:hypothetical protein
VRERIAQQEQHAIGVERLLENVEGAELRGLHRRLNRGVAADHHDHGRRVGGAQPSQRLDAIDAGHLDVEKDQMRAEAVVLAQPIESVRHGVNRVAFVLEQLPERLANAGFVIDDENATRFHGGRHGVASSARYAVMRSLRMRMSPMAGGSSTG